MKKIILKILSVVAVSLLLASSVSAQTAQNLFKCTDETTEFVAETYVADALKDTFKGEKYGFWSDIGSGKNVFVDHQVGLFGHSSVRIENSEERIIDENQRHTVVGVNAPIQRGKTYTFQVWIKTQGVDRERVHIGVEYYQQNHTPLSEYNVTSTPGLMGTNDWTLVSLTFTAPDVEFYAATCGVYLWGATGIIWFDGATLTEGSEVVDSEDIVNYDGSRLTAYAPPTPTPTKVEDRDFIGEYMQVTYVPETIQQHIEKQEKDIFTEALTWVTTGLVAAGCVVFLVMWRIKEQGKSAEKQEEENK